MKKEKQFFTILITRIAFLVVSCCINHEMLTITAENIMGGVGKGVRVLMTGLDLERLVLAAGPVG